MKTFKQFVPSIAKQKKQWGIIISSENKKEFSDDLIRIVQNAYSKTDMGSFVNTVKDVIPSDWFSIDMDNDPDIDACIFYRKNRPNETWIGNKIQGIGHDGARASIDAVLQKKYELLKRKGWWIEASGAAEHLAYKHGVKYVKDENFARKIFPTSGLTMIGDKGKYRRSVAGKTVTETMFGNPVLK